MYSRILADKTAVQDKMTTMGLSGTNVDWKGRYIDSRCRNVGVQFSGKFDATAFVSKAIHEDLYKNKGLLITMELSDADCAYERALLKTRDDLIQPVVPKTELKIRILKLYRNDLVVDLD